MLSCTTTHASAEGHDEAWAVICMPGDERAGLAVASARHVGDQRGQRAQQRIDALPRPAGDAAARQAARLFRLPIPAAPHVHLIAHHQQPLALTAAIAAASASPHLRQAQARHAGIPSSRSGLPCAVLRGHVCRGVLHERDNVGARHLCACALHALPLDVVRALPQPSRVHQRDLRRQSSPHPLPVFP